MTQVSALVKEVYIDPIRSVLVIDDEFICLDKMIDYNIAFTDETKSVSDIRTLINSDYKKLDLKRSKAVIEACRAEGRNWLCDIHDGKMIECEGKEHEIAKHLHQSDLLILDYNLTGDHTDGTRALSLIDDLLLNEHFNLVIVYTNSNIDNVAIEIACNITKVIAHLDALDEEVAKYNLLLAEWDVEVDSFSEELDELFDDSVLLNIIQDFPKSLSKLSHFDFYDDLKDLHNAKPANLQCDIDLLFTMVVKNKYDKIKHKLSGTLDINNSFCFDSGVNWIKNDKLFITVVSKKDNDPSKLPDLLHQALVLWNPKPQRLLMSKLRCELDSRGVFLENSALANDYTHAGWLNEFLSSQDEELRWVTKKTVDKLWDSLSTDMMPSLETFSGKIKSANSDSEIAELIRSYHDLDINDKNTKLAILKHLNAYACSTSVRGNKIATGQVLNINRIVEEIDITKNEIASEEIEGEVISREVINGQVFKREELDGKIIERVVIEEHVVEEYYICLTPACDLVPTQSNDWKKSLGSLMPIKLIRLHESETRFVSGKKCTDEKILSDLNSNDHLLLDIKGEIKGFTILKAAGANPQWEQAFIFDKGTVTWEESDAFTTVHRIYFDDEKGTLSENITKCHVVAQLRYEYAINLLQKFGASQSRVGLDFIEYKA
jgi:hypothetical protein